MDFLYCVLDNPNNCFVLLFQKMWQEEPEDDEVEAVIDERIRNGHTEFQLKYKGYPFE